MNLRRSDLPSFMQVYFPPKDWPPTPRRRLLCWHEWRTERGYLFPTVYVGPDAPKVGVCARCGKTRPIKWKRLTP